MPIKLNTAAFKAVTSHSDALSILCSIAHPCQKSGQYHGRILQGRRVVAHFQLKVDDKCPNTQVDIDLSTLANAGKSTKRRIYSLKTMGFSMFYVSTGGGRYIVELRAADDGGGRPAYSTRVLQKGDVYSAMLIRSGQYMMINTKTETRAAYDVMLPEGGQKALLAAQPLLVHVSKKGFAPENEVIPVSKGVMFIIETPSVIHVDMYKDDEGQLISDLKPENLTPPRWVRPLNARRA